MSESSQRVLNFGENSIFIDADSDESSSNSFWLRIGRIERNDTRHVRLTDGTSCQNSRVRAAGSRRGTG